MHGRLDPLTGLGSQASLQDLLADTIKREKPTAVALLDLDHFGAINRDFGREGGDRVLIAVAELLAGSFGRCCCFRLSGDAFAVLLEGASLEQAFLRMEQLRGLVAASPVAGELEDLPPIRLTAGVAQYPRDAKDADTLLHAADAALTTAKEAGRNQVALPPSDEMVLKACHYQAAMLRRLKALAEKEKKTESALLREALTDLLRKYDRIDPWEAP
ncbi:hypothetical protein J31TS4_08120 [Paenibacillus sp. J31TS4]|uniref:GGDEF domain-containing protein n=1 Tax=Paenibacillus sp. J31TS4 TaxID=2807195 RepID=UPI001B25420E|nr:GGDEF domain-containing protein [Paenibacillus sp. J31TS4]GIP37532.1 hypothetical protein J31TS4_08120 [Paenibacillus sp. J31TS4]